ncbi:fluoride efflux transporter CrcB [Metabacillus sp. GX 13764]|uniref:fluoride efflux transporter CrcB n=1 Tax=Metabacillus kandeliae TaxID=2900151 RepID=UPI001E51ACEC|nr:fluoride efflux transporter CrcB [Metabacillus kandeliae]MCD7036336.1 fluoride efflux transporter CrcB [Metabacillus kandeliae]
MNYLIIGLAGAIGALARYYLGVATGASWHYIFPLATLLANLSGSFILGWFTAYLSRLNKLHPHLVTGIGTGLIGSFTTFSTFSVETVQLIQGGNWGTAMAYVLLSLWGGLLFSWSGFRLGHSQYNKRAAAGGEER